MTFYQIRQFIRYKVFARYRKGFGVHPPFAFKLISEIIPKRQQDFARIREVEGQMRMRKEVIRVKDYGSGSQGIPERRISSIFKGSAVRPKYGSLLTRLAAEYGGDNMLELGTSLGISGMYLKTGRPDATLHTVEGDPALAALARENFLKAGFEGVEVHCGVFRELLTREKLAGRTFDLVFIDGNHTYEGTLQNYTLIQPMLREQSVVIMDDIRSSREMGKAWNKIRKGCEVSLAVDVFQFGILFCNKKLTKGYYLTRY